jgi:hypothetical protein
MKLTYLILIACLSSFSATADEALSAAAKKIFEEKQDCVLWVSTVAKTTFSAERFRHEFSRSREQDGGAGDCH